MFKNPAGSEVDDGPGGRTGIHLLLELSLSSGVDVRSCFDGHVGNWALRGALGFYFAEFSAR